MTVVRGRAFSGAAASALRQAALPALLRRAGEALGVPSRSTLAVRLTDDEELAGLNVTFLGVEAPTDVLAFPGDGHGHVGDVAISVPRALEQGSDGAAELRRLAVHGLLHCLGHDHADPAGAAAMTEATRRLLPDQAVPDLEPGPAASGER